MKIFQLLNHKNTYWTIKTFQYVPILQSLLQVLKNIEEKDLVTQKNTGCASHYQSFNDGSHFHEN